ncbi:MAG: DNA glycosylase AlkZ-like family protein [Sphaerochaetaceae bacterium]
MKRSFSALEGIARVIEVHHLKQKVEQHELVHLFSNVGFHRPTEQSLSIALCSRINDYHPNLTKEAFDSGTIFTTLSFQGGIRTMAKEDWQLFNSALAPINEDELLFLLGPDKEHLTPLSLEGMALLEMVQTVLPEVLDKRPLRFALTQQRLIEALLDLLPPSEQQVLYWPLGSLTLGETLMNRLLPIATLNVPVVLHKEPNTKEYLLSLADEVEQKDFVASDVVARYLHAYGPTDAHSFANWAGISIAQGQRLWESLDPTMLEQVLLEGRLAWMLASDVSSMTNGSQIEGIRFISSFDPILKVPYKRAYTHGKGQYLELFESSKHDNLVLVDTKIAGTWKVQIEKEGWTMLIQESGTALWGTTLQELHKEAHSLESSIGSPCLAVNVR